jgi:hypothetical protein
MLRSSMQWAILLAVMLTAVVQGNIARHERVLAPLRLRGGGEATEEHGKGGWRAKKKQGKGSALPAVPLEPPMGTRDFFPEDLRVRAWLFGHFRAVAHLLGFLEYDAPVLEHEVLYTRKAGEEITAQMYNFVDKGGYNVTLRPEMTPSLARMVVSREKQLLLPLKWFSIPQCWRFENVQRGRKREHFQWNMDIVGIKEVTAEAELIRGVVMLCQRLQLTSHHIGIRINSRKVLGAILQLVGIHKNAIPHPSSHTAPPGLSYDESGKEGRGEYSGEGGNDRSGGNGRQEGGDDGTKGGENRVAVGGEGEGRGEGGVFEEVCVVLDKLSKIGRDAVLGDLVDRLCLSHLQATLGFRFRFS